VRQVWQVGNFRT